MRFETLAGWLQWQETLHFTEVDPGLERIGQVWNKLGGSKQLPFTVITVAGTNGKGSSVAMLESILRQAGYKTGTYTSPHLLSYNERICINNQPCDDTTICDSFQRIDHSRADTSLTYFEFATLAAVDIFQQQEIDICILEVGMGGRLDAVNLFDTDIALITPISLDHTHWLGTNREAIGFEKAGIITPGKPVVCSEEPPLSVEKHADSLDSKVYKRGRNFNIKVNESSWQWLSESVQRNQLSYPALEGDYQIQNAAAVVQVISLLNKASFRISDDDINQGLSSVKLAGRFQRIKDGNVDLILDVTHNQQGANNLDKLLSKNKPTGKTLAVIGMLKDKDAAAIASTLKHVVDEWYLASLTGSRAMTAEQLAQQFSSTIDVADTHQFDSVELAYQQAKNESTTDDQIIVFGSFHTVEVVLKLINKDRT